MHRRCCLLVIRLRWNCVPPQPNHQQQLLRCIIPQAVTQSSAPEDGRNYHPKHVKLIEITNKLLLLHLVGCYIIVSEMHGHTNIKFIYSIYCHMFRPQRAITRLNS